MRVVVTMALLAILLVAGASGIESYVLGNVDSVTIESLMAHNIPVKKACTCACGGLVNDSIVILVQNGRPILIIKSGALFNGTIPPAKSGKIPVLSGNGTVTYVDQARYYELTRCILTHQCVGVDSRESALLLGIGGVVLLLTVYIYNKRSAE